MIKNGDALIVVDVQRDFLPGGALAVPNGDEIVPVLAACIEAFTQRKLPIFASRDWHPPDHCSFREAGGQWPLHCVAGSSGAELDPALRLPVDARIVDKARLAYRDAYSAFEDTALDSSLKEVGVQRLFVGGLATEYCVLETSLDALRFGYEVMLLTDAVRAIDRADGEQAIDTLSREHATITDSGEIFNEQH